jgi:hypothetical protein
MVLLAEFRRQRGLKALTGVLVFLVEELLNLVSNLAVGNLDIVLGGTVLRHEGEETIIGDVELQLNCQRGLDYHCKVSLTSWYS